MIKKVILGALITVIVALVVYLFVYPADYKVNFEAKALPGTINQTLKVWNTEVNGEILSQKGINQIQQRINFSDSIHTYNWDFKAINDSMSSVTVSIKDKNNSILNRIKKPFFDIPIKKQSEKTVTNFYEYLNDHLEDFKITFDGEADLKSTYCAYVAIKGKQTDKARGMMKNYTMLANVLADNSVELNGPPFVEITNWNIEKDSISYNFCFPIIRSEKLPTHPVIKYKRLFAKKALKATYNGNYITSDRAWYTLIKKAKDMGKEVELTPIEYFFNNPNFGGNELGWKADIYLPIIEK